MTVWHSEKCNKSSKNNVLQSSTLCKLWRFWSHIKWHFLCDNKVANDSLWVHTTHFFCNIYGTRAGQAIMFSHNGFRFCHKGHLQTFFNLIEQNLPRFELFMKWKLTNYNYFMFLTSRPPLSLFANVSKTHSLFVTGI